MDVPETPPEQTENGRVPGSEGWFVLNARDAPLDLAPDGGA